jgi:hypothetical protein
MQAMKNLRTLRAAAMMLALLVGSCGTSLQPGGVDAGEDGSGQADGADGGDNLCESDRDCPVGKLCVDGVCRPENYCESNADCSAGTYCNQISYVCVQGECLTDENCVVGMHCVDYQCEGLCEGVECGTGQVCDPATGGCKRMACTISGTACESDAECPPHLRCDPIAFGCTECPSEFFCNIHECFGLNLTCRSHSDCAAGERCNPDSQRCEPYPETCEADKHCEPKYCNLYLHTCQDEAFTGECETDTECHLAFGGEYFCHGRLHNCVLPLQDGGCYDSQDCGQADLVCDLKTNTCAPRGTVCGVDSDCNPDEACLSGVCVFSCPVACVADEDCAFGEVCWNQCCLEDQSCSSDGDCGPGEECIAGWCQQPLPCLSDDAFEDNDDGATATVVVLPAQDQGEAYPGLYICTRDDDWFSIDVPAGSSLTVAIVFSHATGDLDMELFSDPNGSNEVDSSGSTSNQEEVSAFAVADTTYYVRVFGFGGDEGSYELQVIHGEGGVVTNCVGDDGFEQNDAPGSATSLALPAVGSPDSYPGLFLCEGDQDWYQVDVPAGTVITARIAFSAAAGDLELALYTNPSASPVDSSDDYGDDEQVSASAGLDATYYIQVSDSDYSFVSNTYELELSASEAGQNLCAPDDGLEENDAAYNAARLTLPAAGDTDRHPNLILCPGDEDWYAIGVPAGEAITARILFSHSQGDLELKLYDETLTLVDASTSGTDDEEVLVRRVPADTFFFVQVYGFQADGADYDLEIENPGGVLVDCSDGGREPNGGAASATPLAVGFYPVQLICDTQPEDEDWYRVQVAAGERLSAEIVFDGSDADLELALYDATGLNQLDSSTGVSGTERVSGPRALQDSSFLVRVYGYSQSSDVAYSLRLTLEPPVDCTDGGFEPNDSAASVTNLAPGAYTGLYLCATNPADEDWYRIPVQAGQRLSARIAFNDDDGDLDLYLYDLTGANLLDSSTSGYSDVEEVRGPRASQAGGFLVRVASDGLLEDTHYALAIDLDRPLDCSDGGTEPNDTPALATSLSPGVHAGLLICDTDPPDQDWYSVQVAAGERLHATITFDNDDGDLDLHLFDASGQVALDSSTSSFADSEQVHGPRAQSATTYRLQVRTDPGGLVTDTTYQLDIGVEPPLDCTDGGLEPNDDPASAADLGAGAFPGLVICQTNPLDVDWYRVTIGAGERLHAAIAFHNADGNLNLILTEADGSTVVDSSTSSSADSEQVDGPRVAQQTSYLIQVTPVAAGFSIDTTYGLTITIDPPLACGEDAFEPNDDPAQATGLALPGSGPMTLCPGNVDFFALDAQRGELWTLLLVNTTGRGDIDLIVYDPDLVEIARSATSGTGAELLDLAVHVAGTYTVEVVHRDPEAEQVVDYRLDLFADAFVPCDDDAYEPNDNSHRATVLSDMTFVPSGPDWVLSLSGLQVCKPGPSDWYAIDLDLGDALSMLLRFSNADGDIDASLYDENFDTIDTGTTGSDDELLEFGAGGAPMTGRYYLEVFMYTSNRTNTYDLVVTTDRPLP